MSCGLIVIVVVAIVRLRDNNQAGKSDLHYAHGGSYVVRMEVCAIGNGFH